MMIKKYFTLILLMVLAVNVDAQEKFFTKTGRITFFSKAPEKDFEAINKTSSVLFDTKSGALQFSVLMRGFEFERALMQEHFNDNYLESDKYPRSEFKGNITNLSSINFSKDGTYPAKVKGKLTIHGVTKDVESEGSLKIAGGKIDALSEFNILLSDYNISIPAISKNKIGKTILISVDCRLEPFLN
jgi:polyisoprenoid-binding protein YceI